jgi:hypothetical protein
MEYTFLLGRMTQEGVGFDPLLDDREGQPPHLDEREEVHLVVISQRVGREELLALLIGQPLRRRRRALYGRDRGGHGRRHQLLAKRSQVAAQVSLVEGELARPAQRYVLDSFCMGEEG